MFPICSPPSVHDTQGKLTIKYFLSGEGLKISRYVWPKMPYQNHSFILGSWHIGFVCMPYREWNFYFPSHRGLTLSPTGLQGPKALGAYLPTAIPWTEVWWRARILTPSIGEPLPMSSQCIDHPPTTAIWGFGHITNFTLLPSLLWFLFIYCLLSAENLFW